MPTLVSDFKPLCDVVLPYLGRQRYMHGFNLADPVMAEGFEDYLSVVKALCRSAGAIKGAAYMTVDEKVIEAGASQRRPKPHVDGRFYPAIDDWGGGGGQWNHYCNNVGGEGPLLRMPVIVAASVVGCRAWRGVFEGTPAEDGDLSHLNLEGGEVLPANKGFLLSPDCIHESMLMEQTIQRTFLRIALPVDFTF